MKKSLVCACLCAMSSFAVYAEVIVDDAWARATVPQQRASGAFMTLTAERDMKLVEVASGAADRVEIHEMHMEDDVMRMREVGHLELPAGTAVELKPGGYHVMLLDLAEPLEEGKDIELRLIFEDEAGERSEQAVSATVQALTHRHGKDHAHHGKGEDAHHHGH